MSVDKSIVLREIRKIDKKTDIVIDALEQTAKRLEAGIASSYSTDRVEYALARANIERAMVQSGYYEVGEELLDDVMQQSLDSSYSMYKLMYGKELRYSQTSLADLEQLRTAIDIRLRDLGDELTSRLTGRVVDASFGAIPREGAIDLIKADVGAYYKRYVYTYVNTASTDFQNLSSTRLMEDNGIDKFEYVGVLDNLTRPFCSEHIGQVKTAEEWREVINDSGGSAWTERGGWNCRHRLIGVVD